MTLAVEVSLNPNTTNQLSVFLFTSLYAKNLHIAHDFCISYMRIPCGKTFSLLQSLGHLSRSRSKYQGNIYKKKKEIAVIGG